MSAMYEIQYEGAAGAGHGTVYIGRGKVLGTGVGGGRYDGAYAVHGEELVGQASLTATEDTLLVTGQALPAGTQIPINFNLPPSFGDGRFYRIIVAGEPVNVAFKKVGDVP